MRFKGAIKLKAGVAHRNGGLMFTLYSYRLRSSPRKVYTELVVELRRFTEKIPPKEAEEKLNAMLVELILQTGEKFFITHRSKYVESETNKR